MIDRAAILRLIPHQGAMCLLDRVRSWSAEGIVCEARSHLDPANPLRRAGQLATLCGCEYGVQAAALHGALVGNDQARHPGYLAALQVSAISAERLDDPTHGLLSVEATLEMADPGGLIYGMLLRAADGRTLLRARGTIVLPR